MDERHGAGRGIAGGGNDSSGTVRRERYGLRGVARRLHGALRVALLTVCAPPILPDEPRLVRELNGGRA